MQLTTENRPEPTKRRSARIVQAVPLVVTGVDALGRPFQERTSTQAINCHGGRYQSKHYVLKNMWVTLEVPHPQAGQPPRKVRGRVTWIQRPRTVRELFQVAVELEIAGNLWGIAFPPPDWTPFPENAEQLLAAETQIEAVPEARAQEALSGTEPLDNLRVLPTPGGDPSVLPTPELTRLVVEAKQQIQAAVREAVPRAVAEETRPMLAAAENQLKEAARAAAQEAVSAQSDRLAQETLQRISRSGQELLESLRERWHAEAERRLTEASHEFLTRLGSIEETHGAAFDQRLENHLRETLELMKDRSAEITASTARAEKLLQGLNQELDQGATAAGQRIQALIEVKAQEVFARLAELEQAAQRVKDDAAAAAAASFDTWRARLDSARAAAATSWEETISRSIEEAAQRAAERLAQQAESAGNQLDQEIALRLSAQRRAFEDVATQAQAALVGLRETLDNETTRMREAIEQIQQASVRVESQAAGLDELSQAAAAEMQRRLTALLETGSAELQRRIEAALTGMAERLQPVIEAGGQQTLARLAGQMEEQLGPSVDRAREWAEKLSAGIAASEQAAQRSEERVRESSELAEQQAEARLREALGRFERESDEAGRAAAARWLAELDSKAAETTHTTFEALMKAASWYEKKIQIQMHATVERGTETAETKLRQKAGEISGIFAAEIDHYSRSYVEHAQGQMNEVLSDAVEKAHGQMHNLAGEALADLQSSAHQAAQSEREQFAGALRSALDEYGARAESILHQAESRLQADAARSHAEFEHTLDRAIQQGVTQARQDLDAELAPLAQVWTEQRAAQEQAFAESVARLGDASLEGFKQRLENASNSFLVATVASLVQQAQGTVDQLAQSSEQRLRVIAAQIFAGIGESLRQRLLELSASVAPESAAPENPEHNAATTGSHS